MHGAGGINEDQAVSASSAGNIAGAGAPCQRTISMRPSGCSTIALQLSTQSPQFR
jgi:hypothetical protein